MQQTLRSMAWRARWAPCVTLAAWALTAAFAAAQPTPQIPPPVAAAADDPSVQGFEEPASAAKTQKAAPSHSSQSAGGRMADPHEVRRERRRAWIFNRYAGSIEMQDKTPYPYGYYGDYYYRGWKPDWVYPLPPPPVRFIEPPVIRHPEGLPDIEAPGIEQPGLEQPGDQPPEPATSARPRVKRK